jgi:hypothetical protein
MNKKMFRESIEDIANGWNEYWLTKKTNKDNSTHILIHTALPQVLEAWTPNSSRYLIRASDGMGNLLRTPWVATMNREVTESAQEGYYLVYLFSADLKTLVLALGFGAQQFENAYGRGKKFFDSLDQAVINMRVNSEHFLNDFKSDFRSKINKRDVRLDDEGDFKLRAYEKCSIYSIGYSVDDLPTEVELKDDYLNLLALYDAMAGSVILPAVEDYVLEAVNLKVAAQSESAHPRENFDLPDFIQPKRRKKSLSASQNQSQRGSGSRRSKQADKIGRLGEEFVFRLEREKLISNGLDSLANQVILHRDAEKDLKPGWDITSFNQDGTKIFIEVKATIGTVISTVDITANEWAKMSEMKDTNNYKIYLVVNIASSPKVLGVISNPAKFVNNGDFQLRVETYSLDLRGN